MTKSGNGVSLLELEAAKYGIKGSSKTRVFNGEDWQWLMLQRQKNRWGKIL
jgi:hypothetical protein